MSGEAEPDAPGVAVIRRQKAIGIGGAGSLSSPASSPLRFVARGQRAAILKQVRNPTAAKLYLNWQLSAAQQQAAFNGWSVRTDVTPPAGLKLIWKYPNAHLDGFPVSWPTVPRWNAGSRPSRCTSER